MFTTLAYRLCRIKRKSNGLERRCALQPWQSQNGFSPNGCVASAERGKCCQDREGLSRLVGARKAKQKHKQQVDVEMNGTARSLTNWQDDEEREPAEEKSSDDDSQRFRRFLLPPELEHFGRQSGAGRRAGGRCHGRRRSRRRSSRRSCWRRPPWALPRMVHVVGGQMRCAQTFLHHSAGSFVKIFGQLAVQRWRRRQWKLLLSCCRWCPAVAVILPRWSIVTRTSLCRVDGRPGRLPAFGYVQLVGVANGRHRFHRRGPPDVDPQRQYLVAERRGGLVRFGAALQELCLLDGGPVDAPVDGQDDQRRQVKRANGREEDVALFLVDVAGLLVHRRWVRRRFCRRRQSRRRFVTGYCREVAPLLPAQQRADADGQGGDPDNQAEDGGAFGRYNRVVVEWSSHADIAVHGDDAQGHDRGCATEDVHRRPHVAENGAEIPVARHLKVATDFLFWLRPSIPFELFRQFLLHLLALPNVKTNGL